MDDYNVGVCRACHCWPHYHHIKLIMLRGERGDTRLENLKSARTTTNQSTPCCLPNVAMSFAFCVQSLYAHFISEGLSENIMKNKGHKNTLFH